MGIEKLLYLLGMLTFDQPWVMTAIFLVFYLVLGLVAFSRPAAAIVMYFGTSIMNPQMNYPFFMSIPLAKVAAGLSLLTCLLNAQKVKFRFPATFVPMAAFLAMVVVSASSAIRPELADQRLEEFLKVGLMTFLAVWAVGSREEYDFLFWGILCSLFFNVLKNLVETQTRGTWVAVRGTAGWITDSNDWALALAMGLPLFYTALALCWPKGWKARLGLGLAAVGALLTLTMTSSRGGFLAAAISATIFMLMDRKPRRAIVLGAVLAGVAAIYMPQSYADRVTGIFGLKGTATSAWDKQLDDDQEYTGAERVFYWRIAYELMQEHPLTGVGWGNFIQEFKRREHLAEGVVAHSTWFQVGAEAGMVSLSAYVLMIVTCLASAVRTWRRARRAQDRWGELHSRAVACGLLAFCVGATFLSRENSELLFVYCAMSAILACLIPRKDPAVP